MLDWLLTLDTQLFHAINTGWINPFFDWLMPIITDETGAIILIGILVITAVVDRKKGWIVLIFVLIGAALSDPLVARFFKPLFARPRPCRVLCVHLLDRCSRSFSFPSAHAVNIFTYAIAYGSVYKKSLWALLPVAVLVALSRVYVGVHYPLDIFVGSIIGMGLGYGIGRIELKIIERRLQKLSDIEQCKIKDTE